MRNSALVKQEFLKKWIKGLRICTKKFNKEKTSISDRKNAIKLSADVAIASTRKASTQWSRALVEKRGLIACSRRIIRRSHVARRRVVPGSNKTRLLKKLVPGGQQMNGISLIKETLDYILALRLQVDVMSRLAQALDHSSKTLS